MVKLITIFSLEPGVDSNEAYKMWREKHASWVKDRILPEAKRYTINKVMHKYPPAGGTVADFDIFGYEMFWFTDLKSALKAAGRLQSAQPDEFLARFAKVCKMVIVEGENIKL